MGPKDAKSLKSRKGKKPSTTGLIETSFVEPQARTLEQWEGMGKESLILISNSFNMDVKGVSTHDMAAALVEKYKSQPNDMNTNETSDVLFDIDDVWDDARDEEEGGDADMSAANSTFDLRKVNYKSKKVKSKKKKQTNTDLDLYSLKNELKLFLQQEVNNALPPLRNSQPPCSPVPSPFSAPGSLAPTIGNNGAVPTDVQDVVRDEASHSFVPWGEVSGGVRSFSLPPIPKRVLEKIKLGEYVNFDLLLPPSLSASATATVSSLPMDGRRR